MYFKIFSFRKKSAIENKCLGANLIKIWSEIIKILYCMHGQCHFEYLIRLLSGNMLLL